jgi:hypothetical protein
MENTYKNYFEIRNICKDPSKLLNLIYDNCVQSIPLPTQRKGHYCYACYDNHILDVDANTIIHFPPDHWWLISAISGELLFFSHYEILPFAADMVFQKVTLAKEEGTNVEVYKLLERIDIIINEVSPFFFNKTSPGKSKKEELAGLLNNFIPKELINRYCKLTPDFFKWLGF